MVIVPARSAIEYQRHERYTGKASKEAAVHFFFKGTNYICVTWSDWRRPHKPSRKSVLQLQFGEDVSSMQVGRVTLGLLFCINFPSFRNSSCRWEAVFV